MDNGIDVREAAVVLVTQEVFVRHDVIVHLLL